MKAILAAGALVLAMSVPASANPAAGLASGGQADVQSSVELVHGWHRSCQRGYRGWHYHSRTHGHVPCGHRPHGEHWRWHFHDGRWGWWHHRERRWHH